MSLVTLGLLGFGPFKHLRPRGDHPVLAAVLGAIILVAFLVFGAAAVHEVGRVHAQEACQCSLP